MQPKRRFSLVIHTALALLAIVLASGVGAANAAPLPASTACTAPGTGTVTCEIWATTGTLSLPPSLNVPIWGYSDASGGAASLPGPTLIAEVGDVVQVTLHNDLSVATSLNVTGLAMKPDLSGVPAGGTKIYQFTASAPGTFLYEAGLLPNTQYQVAMGLFGALVVRPSGGANQAFDNPDTAFDDEALLVLSEVDPALNNRANPATFDMRRYRPRYFLINGKAYPQTSMIDTGAGNRVLLRYANAGQQSHTLALLGMHQKTLAFAGVELPNARRVISEELTPGQTADMLVIVPSSATIGARYPLYEAGMLLHNNGAQGFGGMITFLNVLTGSAGGGVLGPATSGASASPNPANDSADVSLSATVSDVETGGSNIQAAEYFIGTQGTAGSGTPMAAADLDGFNSPTEAVTGLISNATLTGMSSGSYPIHIHGQDADGHWGAFNVVTLILDKTGPATYAITLTPRSSNGSVSVNIDATSDDSTAGGSNVTAAEYFLDIDIGSPPAEGTGTPLSINQNGPVVALSATIPAATMQGLSPGAHSVYIRSMDALDNWGSFAVSTLMVDQTGPDVTGVTAIPSALDAPVTVRVNATASDALVAGAQSNIAAAELFIDSAGSLGTGLAMLPTDGAFNSPSETVYAFIPQSQINALTNGTHTIFVRARDASGNWGLEGSGSLIIDPDSPDVTGVSASPNPTEGATDVTLTATASDPTSMIAGAEWFRNADPGTGMGAPMSAVDGTFDSLSEAITASINVTGWAPGSHTLYVRARDAAGHWSAAESTVLEVSAGAPTVLFADSFESGDTSAWSASTGANVSVTPAAALQGAYGMEIALAGNTPGYVSDDTPANEAAYHARFYFDPRSTISGAGLIDIMSGRNTSGVVIWRLQYRRTAAGATQVRLSITRAGGISNTAFFNLNDNAANSIEIDWESAASGTARLYVNGALAQTLAGLNTSAYTLDNVRFGPSFGLNAGTSGTPYFDAFVSSQSTYIGP